MKANLQVFKLCVIICLSIFSIKKQGDSMNSFKMLIKVKKCDDDSKKICLIQQFASEMDSLILGKAIAKDGKIKYLIKFGALILKLVQM